MMALANAAFGLLHSCCTPKQERHFSDSAVQFKSEHFFLGPFFGPPSRKVLCASSLTLQKRSDKAVPEHTAGRKIAPSKKNLRVREATAYLQQIIFLCGLTETQSKRLFRPGRVESIDQPTSQNVDKEPPVSIRTQLNNLLRSVGLNPCS